MPILSGLFLIQYQILMKIVKHFTLIFAIAFAVCACGDKNKESANVETGPVVSVSAINPEDILKMDLKQDLSNKSLQELRLLRNAVYARQGYCFMQADLRGYFSGHMTGYDSIMEARFWDDENEKKTMAPITLSKEETEFIKKIETLEAEKKRNNYLERNGTKIGNVQNIINLFQFNNLSNDFMTLLDKHNFAIVPTENIQLFHVYEKNDYAQIPNFVTTDTYLQLYHMYFSYLLKSIEQTKFIPTLTGLSEAMYEQAVKTSATVSDPSVKISADFAATFYAIPYYILTGNKKIVPSTYKDLFEKELKNIEGEADAFSEFLDYKDVYFPYSLYKPRGHYTRNAELKKYFKAMMWMQTAAFCREESEQLKHSALMAYLLEAGKLMDAYNSIYEPIVFLIGEPDNLSVNDIVTYFKANHLTDPSVILSTSTQQKVDVELQRVLKTRNKIKPKIEVSCPDKINFMPQRYLFDNEIMQELADVKQNAERAYPKGMDLFAALGNKTAKEILLKEEKEGDKWNKYPSLLEKLERKFENYKEWDKTVYNKWIHTLLVMQKKDKDCPAFMATDMWDRKNLNTSLASWTDLKHDAILYGEQPEAAECGGAGPPPPFTVGYVEPNVLFWKNMLELLTLTEGVLKRNGLMTEDISSKTTQLKESAQFLYSASQKEIKKQKLSEQEYRTIEFIGASIEYLTLSIIEPGKSLDSWENVSGPDKAVSVVADVYTRNVPGCEKNGILHEAVGNVNEIYVVVEIEGYLYLTKGATFSYFEFVRPLGERLTDEQWQKMLEEKKDLPSIPAWLKEIILPSKEVPVSDEKIFYSSGC